MMLSQKTFDYEIALLTLGTKMDHNGNQIETVTNAKTIFANVESVSRNEFYAAATVDMKPELIFSVHWFEYDGQKRIRYKNNFYNVIRTYTRDELIELVVSSTIGD